MQPILLLCLFCYRRRLFFPDFPVNIWVASFMVYAFHGSTILQSGVQCIANSIKSNSQAKGILMDDKCKNNVSRSKRWKRKSPHNSLSVEIYHFQPKQIIHMERRLKNCSIWDCVTNCTQMGDCMSRLIFRMADSASLLLTIIDVRHARKPFLVKYHTGQIKKHLFRKVFQSAKARSF